MKKYIFTKDLTLGMVQLNVKKGQSVLQQDGFFEYQRHKYQNTKDFEIAIKYGWLVEQKDVKNVIEKKEQVKETSSVYGFEIKKQTVDGVIPLKNFVQLNEKDGYVQDGENIIPIDQTDVHVAPQKEEEIKQEEMKEEEIKQEQSDAFENIEENNEIKIEETAEKKEQVEEIKENIVKQTKKETKKSNKSNSKKTEKTVRGMKIIQGA